MRIQIGMLICAISVPAYSAEIGDVTAREGQWELRQNKDAFTDAVNCTIAAKERPYIQAGNSKIIFSGFRPNSLTTFRYRLDDTPPSQYIIPNSLMQSVGAIYIEGAVYQEFLQGKRLRIEITTSDDKRKIEDIRAVGFKAIKEIEAANCK